LSSFFVSAQPRQKRASGESPTPLLHISIGKGEAPK
jgi:hypothetical protein